MIRLTRREREVLVELCRPLLESATFREPAPTRDIAKTLFVSEAAVKQHLPSIMARYSGAAQHRADLGTA